MGADELMACQDGGEDPLNGAAKSVVKGDKLFNPAIHDMDTVFEIGLPERRS